MRQEFLGGPDTVAEAARIRVHPTHCGRAKPTGLLKSVCDLPDGVVFKCLEYKFGTAGVRVPRIEDIDRAQKESGIMEAIQALAETLQISNGEAIELIMREEANVPDYA